MTFKTRQTTGLLLLVLGFLLLLVNALDYILGWKQFGSAFIIVGIMFLAVGAGLAKRARGGAAVTGENPVEGGRR